VNSKESEIVDSEAKLKNLFRKNLVCSISHKSIEIHNKNKQISCEKVLVKIMKALIKDKKKGTSF